MHIHRETEKGFVSLLSCAGGVNWKGQAFPPKHSLSVAEFGVGINHYDLTPTEAARVIGALRPRSAILNDGEGE